MTRTISVAIAGCGTVGGSLLDLLARHGEEHQRRAAVRFEVTGILVRDPLRPRSPRVPRELLTDSIDRFLGTRADIVVEAIGGIGDADRLVRAALERGSRVVTANKALLRVAGAELSALVAKHRERGAALDIEAADGGGEPVVRLLRESLAGHGVRSVRGVLNGTTNFILTRIARGSSYAQALDAARRAGFAEADPTRDLDGTDAADKIAVLAWLAFGADPRALRVDTVGLPADVEAAVRSATERGRVLRLVATAARTVRGPRAFVRPMLLHRADPLARARDEENVVQVESESCGTITLSGKGAGGPATASAILADLLRAAQSPIPASRYHTPHPPHLTPGIIHAA